MHTAPLKLRIPLNGILIVPFVLQLSVAVGIVGYISFRTSQTAVNDVARQLREELSERIKEELESYTSIPHAVNRINASAVSEGNIDISGVRGEIQFWQQMQIFSNISYVYCGNEQGAFIGVSRLKSQDRSQLFLQYSNSSTQFFRRLFSLDAMGNRNERLNPPNRGAFDPRKRPWYSIARTSRGSVWSKIYLDFSTSFPTITASYPVFDKNTGQFMAVCASDFYLPKEMSSFLQSLKIGKTGTAFIIEADGKLVASSTPEPITTGTGKNTERLFASESPNPAINATANMLLKEFPDGQQTQIPLQLDFLVDGKKQFVQVIPYSDFNLKWWIVLTIPESDFMSGVHENTRNTVLLTLASLLIAIGIGIITASRVIRPIADITLASQAIAKGNLDQSISPSMIYEMNILGTSFMFMRDSLKTYIAELQIATAAQQKIESELAIATEIQMSMLPKSVYGGLGDGRYDVSAILQPARQVGGDLYDFFLIDENSLLVTIGDVAGKGVPAALMMSRTLTLIRLIAKNSHFSFPAKILTAVNQELCYNNDECIFVTLFCGILKLDSGEFNYASAGHDPPILISQNSVAFLPLETGSPLGIDEDAEFPSHKLFLLPGDIFLLYTDGITEAMNEKDEFFSDQRLMSILESHPPCSVARTVQTVQHFHREYIQNAAQSDDLTLLALQFQPTSLLSKRDIAMDFQITINNELMELERVQQCLLELLEQEGASSELIGDAQLIMEEILINIISYAYPNQTNQSIDIKIKINDQSLIMVFIDQGIPFDPVHHLSEIDLDARGDIDRAAGGLGIYLVKQLSQHLSYEYVNNQNVLTVVCN